MQIVTVLLLLGLMVAYGLIAAVGFVMGAFCFDQGTSPGAWGCFLGINGVFSGPAVIAIIVGWVQFFRRRFRSALVIAAIPALLAAIAYVVLFFVTASYL
jgi:hypothetical protein